MFKATYSMVVTLMSKKSVRLACSVLTTRACSSEALALRSRKPKSKNTLVQYFVDRLQLRCVAGAGGDGCVSLNSNFMTEFGGPDGGDGGNGGHVIFLSTNNVKNLNHISRVLTAKNGEKGSNKDCNGKNAEHFILNVPLGTVVRTEERKVIADLNEDGKMFIAARGGAGGKGNKFFATDTTQAPVIAEYGAIGERKTYILEVKSMAHIGLLGFPNAGKSTLLRAISRARPKVAPYPFTTLQPHIGMVLYNDHEQLAVADLPGLIEGSHMNRGLGIQFLQHAERCCCLVFMIDTSIPEPWKQLECLKFELSQFSEELVKRPHLIIANKIDLPQAEKNLPKLKEYYKDLEVIPISAKMGTNLSTLLKIFRKMYDENIEKTTC